jgi:hypothetical protein
MVLGSGATGVTTGAAMLIADPVWSKYSNVLKPWVMSPRAEWLWENVTRQIWTV